MEYALEIKNLSKQHNSSQFSLNNISLQIPKGSVMGFVGANGAGKSTTMHAILNIIFKDSGNILFYGSELTDQATHLREDIGVVFDTTYFSGELTPIRLNDIFKDIYKNWETRIFYKLLTQLRVPIDKPIKSFSRGMTMKLSMAVALSHNAKLLILDEATAGLDQLAREMVLDILKTFMKDKEHAILLSSHITSDLEEIADIITFIDNGTIVLTEQKTIIQNRYATSRIPNHYIDQVDTSFYIGSRTRGKETTILIRDKRLFLAKYPNVKIKNAQIQDILPLVAKGVY